MDETQEEEEVTAPEAPADAVEGDIAAEDDEPKTEDEIEDEEGFSPTDTDFDQEGYGALNESGDEEGEEWEEEEEEEDECFKPLQKKDTWNSLSYEEKKYWSKIYIEILMDIGTQNRILNAIRKRLCYLQKDNPCPTKCEKREIRGLKCCVKRETFRLQCYMRRAQDFLANAPNGPWDAIPIVPSAVEECVPTELGCTMLESVCQSALEACKKKKPTGGKC